ncbi:MAG: ACT domain-containing protein [Pseudomonadales bacterium]
MRCSLVLGVMCEDRPGILDILSTLITDHEGEWTESKMVTMAGKFAGILTVELPCREQQPFTDAVNGLAEQGLKVNVERIEVHVEPQVHEFQLEMVGQDRPGIVREITHLLAKHDINLEALESRIESASMSGETLFIAAAVVHIPEQVDMNKLQNGFDELANELMVDIKLSE